MMLHCCMVKAYSGKYPSVENGPSNSETKDRRLPKAITIALSQALFTLKIAQNEPFLPSKVQVEMMPPRCC